MAKRVALRDYVSVDDTELSGFCRSVEFASEHERIDVSGFAGTTGSTSNEYLAGPTEQSVTCEFYGSYGTGEVHQTIYNTHATRAVVPFAWRPDASAVTSITNPELRGNVQIYTYNPGATRGEVESFSVTFNAADEDGLQFFTTPAA